MRNLVEIFNTNDLRWLLKVDELPEEYDTLYLVPVLDEIIFEYEELKGDKFYTNYLRKSDLTAKDAIKLVLLRWSQEILKCNPLKIKEVEKILAGFKVKADSSDKIDREIKLLTQRLQVKAMKDAGKEVEKENFGKMCAMISGQLENVSIKEVRAATVTEFLGYRDIITELHAKNG